MMSVPVDAGCTRRMTALTGDMRLLVGSPSPTIFVDPRRNLMAGNSVSWDFRRCMHKPRRNKGKAHSFWNCSGWFEGLLFLNFVAEIWTTSVAMEAWHVMYCTSNALNLVCAPARCGSAVWNGIRYRSFLACTGVLLRPFLVSACN